MRKAQYTLLSFILASFILLSLIGIIANLTVDKTEQLNKTQLLIRAGDTIRNIQTIQREERQVGIDFTDVHLGMLGGWPRGSSLCGSAVNDSADWLIKSTPYWFSSPETAQYYSYTADTDCDSFIDDCKAQCSDDKCLGECEMTPFDCVYYSSNSETIFRFANIREGLYNVNDGDDNSVDFYLDGDASLSDNPVFLQSGGHSFTVDGSLSSLTLQRVIPSSTSITCPISDNSFNCFSTSCNVINSLSCSGGNQCFIEGDYLNCAGLPLLTISSSCSIGADYFLCDGVTYPFSSYDFVNGELVSDGLTVSAGGDCVMGDDEIVCSDFSCSVSKSLSCDNANCFFTPDGIKCDNGIDCDSDFNCVKLSDYASCIPSEDFVKEMYSLFLNNYFPTMSQLAFDQIRGVALSNGFALDLSTPIEYNTSINDVGSNALFATFYPLNIPTINLFYNGLANVNYQGSTIVYDAFRSDFASYLSSARELINNNGINDLINKVISKHSSFSFRASVQVNGSSYQSFNTYMNDYHNAGWNFGQPLSASLDIPFTVKPYCVYYLKEACMFLSDELPDGLNSDYEAGSTTLYDSFTRNAANLPDDWGNCLDVCRACHDVGSYNNPCINLTETSCQDCFSCVAGESYDSISDNSCRDLVNIDVKPLLNEYIIYRFNDLRLDLPFSSKLDAQRLNITDISFYDMVTSQTGFNSSCYNCKTAVPGDNCLFLNSSLNISDAVLYAKLEASDCCPETASCPFNVVYYGDDYCIISSDDNGFLQLPYTNLDVNASVNISNTGNTDELVNVTLLFDFFGNLAAGDNLYYTAGAVNDLLPNELPLSNVDVKSEDLDGHYDNHSLYSVGLINHGSSKSFNTTFNPYALGIYKDINLVRVCAQTSFNDEWDWTDNCKTLSLGGCSDGSEDVSRSCCEASGYTWLDSIDYYGACCGDDAGICRGLVFHENFDSVISQNVIANFDNSVDGGFDISDPVGFTEGVYGESVYINYPEEGYLFKPFSDLPVSYSLWFFGKRFVKAELVDFESVTGHCWGVNGVCDDDCSYSSFSRDQYYTGSNNNGLCPYVYLYSFTGSCSSDGSGNCYKPVNPESVFKEADITGIGGLFYRVTSCDAYNPVIAYDSFKNCDWITLTDKKSISSLTNVNGTSILPDYFNPKWDLYKLTLNQPMNAGGLYLYSGVGSFNLPIAVYDLVSRGPVPVPSIIDTGRDSSVMAFDGYDDEVRYNFNGLTSLNDFTVSAWFRINDRPTSTHSYGLISTRFGSDHTFDLKITPSGFHADIGDGSSWLTTSADCNVNIPLDEWHMITYSVNSDGYFIYFDGSLKCKGELSGNPLFMKPSQELVIGNSYNGLTNEHFKGLIDDVRVYNHALTNNLDSAVSEWPFNTDYLSSDGLTALDVINFNDAQLIGSRVYNDKLFLDGLNDYAEVIDDSSIRPEGFTVSMWVYPYSLSQIYGPGSIYETNNNLPSEREFLLTKWPGYSLELDESHRAFFRVNTASGVIDSPLSAPFKADEWYHVVGVFNPLAGVSLYVNGELVGTTPAISSIVHSSNNLYIGHYSNNYFGGYVKDVSFYDAPLTDVMVNKLFDDSYEKPVNDLFINSIIDDSCSTADNFIANDNEACYNGVVYTCPSDNLFFLSLRPADQIRNFNYDGPLTDYYCSINN